MAKETYWSNAWIDFSLRNGQVVSHYFSGDQVEEGEKVIDVSGTAHDMIKGVLLGPDEFFTAESNNKAVFSMIRVAEIVSATLRYTITED